MKIRSLKLREAHKPAGVDRPSCCSVLWDQRAHHLVTASSSDPAISIHDALLPSSPPRILRHHRDGVTALAISPNSTCLASGSIDHSVKLYKFPGGDFQTNVTRFTLPIRALAFNKSGSMLAAAGDDEGLKLINTIDGSIARVLKGHKGSVTGLAFDPNGEYLASMDSMGTVIYWELHSGATLHTLKGIAPNCGSDFSVINVLSWSPDGETLAVPGLKNDVVMYDRDTAEKLFSLRGDHLQSVCYLSWSPNGKYMATSGLDRQVLIWDVDKKQDIDRQKFDERICCMSWKPIGNALAVIDTAGKYGVWESVIPSSMKSPAEGIPNSRSNNSNGLLLFDEEEEEYEEPSAAGSISDPGEDSFGESGPPCRKRLRKQSTYDELWEEDDNDKLSSPPKPKSRKECHDKKKASDNVHDGLGSIMLPARSKMQDAFQPGSTPAQPGKRRFLCYNMIGSITTIEQEGYSHIEIDFHDTGKGPRVPSMTDHFGFTMASINENGSVFANPCKGEKNLSTLMYRPFCSWASNSEWSMRFEGEEVKAVALGTGWVAAITSLNLLRIFTEGGLQKHVVSLEGPVVTASGFKDELAVVTHSSDCLSSGDQVVEFTVFNISKSTKAMQGRLPLTPGSQLMWFGFSEEGLLSSYDSKGLLKIFASQYGGSWVPLFSASKVKRSDESYWVVGLNMTNLFCVICKSPDLFPQVAPKPVLSLVNFSIPLASSDIGAETLENEFILNYTHLSQIHHKIEAAAQAGMDVSSLEDDVFNVEAAQDKCILRLIASCCNSDKLARATELVKLLSLEKSVRGAIKLVTALKLPNLAERFNSILEVRLLAEKGPKDASALNVQDSASTSITAAAVSEKKTDAIMTLTTPKLSAPLFIKKVKSQEGTRVGGSDQIDQDVNPSIPNDGATKFKDQKIALQTNVGGEIKKPGNVHELQSERPSSGFPKSTDNLEKIKNAGQAHRQPPQRPSNPFLKSAVK
ncbi:protein ENHANCER OF LHP1 1 [Rhodamnia argentea]|uniref:Protein ENHANCER OF LHP1 1 n=1 Tax=Rhodamnia argentea TaxID=178133 RepID=A0A8B8NH03_9MYRT|nr:protein ENHANCER OF LHP1 1 [Rhodamnia argentea]